jgi:hypothetical protein
MTNYACPCHAESHCRTLLRSLTPLPCETDYAGEAPTHKPGPRKTRLGKVQIAMLAALQQHGEMDCATMADVTGYHHKTLENAGRLLRKHGLVEAAQTHRANGRQGLQCYRALTHCDPERIRVRV